MSTWPRRVVKFLTINTLLVPVNIGIATGLTFVGLHYLLATLVGIVVHISIAFFIHRKQTFQREDLHAGTGILRGLVVEFSGFGIVLFAVYVFVDLLGLSFLSARIIAALLVGVWDYLVHSWVTFKTHPFK